MYGSRLDLSRQRRRVGIAIVSLAGLWLVWALAPGLPVLRAPRAKAAVRQAGLNLFVHEWQPRDQMAHGDGLGPVFNARSCVACHFQGGVGGGGGLKEDVVAYEARPTPGRPVVQTGLIHKFAVEPRYSERAQLLDNMFPTVPNGLLITGVCFSARHDFVPVQTQSLNSIALFGAGWIDRLSVRSITHHRMRRSMSEIGRELGGDFGGVPPGRPRILADGRIGKFGWKAQFATLEEFVAAACANEIGLGTHRMAQAQPLGCTAPPAVGPDLDKTQFQALVSFVATLPRPIEVPAADPDAQTLVDQGKEVFARIGCAACHTPDLGGIAGVYSDFLLHRIVDTRKSYTETPEVPLPPDHPLPEEWKTPPLWGVADSAPYFHDGGSPTLDAAVLRHEGDAARVTEAYRKLRGDEHVALFRFLKSLKAPSDAAPAPTPGAGQSQLALAR